MKMCNERINQFQIRGDQMKRWFMLVLAIAFLLILAACGNDNSETEPATETDGATEVEDENVNEGEENPPNGEEAEGNSDEGSSEDLMFVTVDLMNSDGDAIGTAEINDEENGVTVGLDLTDLETGTHKVQFLDAGKCEVPDFQTAGEVYGEELPSVDVGDDGTVQEELTAEGFTLKTEEENSLLQEGGTSLVLESEESSERVACGVVTGEN